MLDGLEARRGRFQRAYGDGLMSYEDFAARIRELEAQGDSARQILADVEDHVVASRRREDQMTRLARIIEAVPEYLLEAPGTEVNRILHELFEDVVIDAGGRLLEARLR